MRSIIFSLLVSLSFVAVSCSDMLLESDPDDTPRDNFNILWSEFDTYYALFEVKQINWDSLHDAYGSRITSTTTDRELFAIISSMLANLHDAHISLTTPFGTFNADTLYDDSSGVFERGVVLYNYLRGDFATAGGERIFYGMLPDDIGYLTIPSFAGAIEAPPGISNWAREIDTVLKKFQGARGIIIDIRGNDGGNSFNGAHIAGRFADTRRLYQISRSRNGPEHDDFGSEFERYLEPIGATRFTGPVVLLTNNRTISAAEWFAMAMKELPNVTIIGDTTAGNLSGRMERELPNGWIYTVSVQKIVSPDGISYEGRGIPPDIPAVTTRRDIATLRDPILERAMEALRE